MFMPLLVFTQNLGTDIEGYSTIYTKGSNLSLDAINNTLNFDFYKSTKFKKDLNTDAHKSEIYGVSVKGKSNNGLANLITSGEINAATQINLVYGSRYYKNKKVNNYQDKVDEIQNELSELVQPIIALRAKISDELAKQKKQYIHGFVEDMNGLLDADKNELKSIIVNKEPWKEKEKKIKILEIDSEEELLEKISLFNDKVKGYRTGGQPDIWRQIKNNLQKLHYINTTTINTLLDEMILHNIDNDALEEELRKLKEGDATINAFLVKVGVSEQEFQYDLDNSGATAEERIKDEEFTALSFEIIFNKQFKYYNFFGISFKGERANNFDALEAKEITFGEAGTENEETYSAFAGDYDTFNRFSFNADYMRLVPIDSEGTDNMYLTINPYVRHFVYSGATNLKNNTNLGLGVNIFNKTNNKLMGGAFVQANDIFSVNTKQALGRKVAIGLVVKFAFEGFNFEEKID